MQGAGAGRGAHARSPSQRRRQTRGGDGRKHTHTHPCLCRGERAGSSATSDRPFGWSTKRGLECAPRADPAVGLAPAARTVAVPVRPNKRVRLELPHGPRHPELPQIRRRAPRQLALRIAPRAQVARPPRHRAPGALCVRLPVPAPLFRQRVGSAQDSVVVSSCARARDAGCRDRGARPSAERSPASFAACTIHVRSLICASP